MTGGFSSSKTAAYPLGGEKGIPKTLREVPVYILQVSLLEYPVGRLIGAAAAPINQTNQHLAPPATPLSVGTPGASARVSCAGASTKTVEASCRGRQGRAFIGTSVWWNTLQPQTLYIAGRCKRSTVPRGGGQKRGREYHKMD